MFESLQLDMDDLFRTVEATWNERREAMFDRIEQDLLPVPIHKVEEEEGKMPSFFQELVPNLLDQTVGHFDRQLQKDKETFHIEQKKEERREGKIVQLANQHMQDTAQSLEDEQALWQARASTLESEVVEDRRRAQRIEEKRIARALEELIALKNRNDQEAREREVSDSRLLDNMVDVQSELQRITLEKFGQLQEGKS